MSEKDVDPMPQTRAERRAVLMAIHGQLTSSAQAYHNILISMNVALISTNVFVGGYLLSFAAAKGEVPRLLLAAVPLLIAGLGSLVTTMVWRHYRVAASLIRRIDEVNGVFRADYLLPGEPLYPEAWRQFGGRRWHEAEFVIFHPLHLLLGTIVAALVWLR